MTDEQLREALKKAIHEGLGGNGWAYANYGGDELVSQADGLGNAANAAIALMRPVYRSQALEDVIKMLAGREDLIGAVQFRHIAAAIRALSTP